MVILVLTITAILKRHNNGDTSYQVMPYMAMTQLTEIDHCSREKLTLSSNLAINFKDLAMFGRRRNGGVEDGCVYNRT